MPKGQTLKNAFLGTVVAVILYTFPGINLAAPFIGGLAAGYSQRQGLRGGMKVGVVMAVLMLIPGFLISTLLMQIPEIGVFLGLSWIVVSFLLISHSVFMSVLGGIIGGAISERR